tara:strand:+ start:5972 stop:7597 length:1626 start_codon:yes stop_codon:yes gene_type:complete
MKRKLFHIIIRLVLLTVFASSFPNLFPTENTGPSGKSNQQDQDKKKKKKKRPTKKKKSSSKKRKKKPSSKSKKKKKRKGTKKRPGKKKRTKSKSKPKSKLTAPSARKESSATKSELKQWNVYEHSDKLFQLKHKLDSKNRNMDRKMAGLKPIDMEQKSAIKRASPVLAPTSPEDYRFKREKALDYESRGMFASAKDIYLRLIASDPVNPDFHYFLGSLYTSKGHYQKAKLSFSEALEIDPNHTATLNTLAHLNKSGEGREVASSLYGKVSEKVPEGTGQFIKDLKDHLESENFKEALSVSRESMNKFPDNYIFPYYQGRAYEGLDDFENAKKSYRTSMSYKDTDPIAAVSLGDLYDTQGNYLYAAVTYESVLNKKPHDIGLRFKHGLSYFKSYEWAKASASWEDLLHYSPNHSMVLHLLPQAYYILSLEYNRTGFSDLGRRAFANAIAVNSRTHEWLPDALKTAGEYYREIDLHRKSLNAYQDAIDIVPSDDENYTGLGITYWVMGEKEMARAAWGKSLALKPEDNSAKGWLLLAGRQSDF